MYRLTIDQTKSTLPYIVVDCQTLEDVSNTLNAYKKQLKESNSEEQFIHYDIIEFNEILEDSYTLEDVSLSELKKEGRI